ncbi:MAG: TetR/AcrR family transcriptional regulator [Acidimicrobiales bacterium]
MVERLRKASPRRTQAERSEATRSALIAAARRLFAEQGYGEVGREAVVAAAGVTRGALQHHFGDKRGLFLAVYEQVEQQVVAATATAASTQHHGKSIEMLRAGCHAYLDAVLDPAVQRICAIDGPAVLNADERQEISDRYALGLVREVVQQAMGAGEIATAPVEPLTRMLLAAVTAAAQFVATSPDPALARREAGDTVDVLLSSLRVEP